MGSLSMAASPGRTRLKELLIEKSVRTGSFTLASGRKSSFYIDARVTTMSAEGLELIGVLGLEAVRSAGWAMELVGGLTMGADPVAYAMAAASRRLPPAVDAFSVRKEAKGHGLSRRVEGCFTPGRPVVVAEDVITTGASAVAAVTAVREAGGIVSGVLAVVDRGEGGIEAIRALGVPVASLITAGDLGVGQ